VLTYWWLCCLQSTWIWIFGTICNGKFVRDVVVK
jgi:hypothetical protein